MYTTEKCLPCIGTYPNEERRPLSISTTNSYCTCVLSYPIYLYVYSMMMIIIILYYCSQNERDICQNSFSPSQPPPTYTAAQSFRHRRRWPTQYFARDTNTTTDRIIPFSFAYKSVYVCKIIQSYLSGYATGAVITLW